VERRAPTELAALKARWLEDSHWVIEDADGVEAHWDERRQLRLETQAKREQEKRLWLIRAINQYQAEKQTKWAARKEPVESKADAQ
jgi:hypothetical protein